MWEEESSRGAVEERGSDQGITQDIKEKVRNCAECQKKKLYPPVASNKINKWGKKRRKRLEFL